MVNNNLLSFPQSIEATQALMNKIKNKELNEIEIQNEVSTIVNTKNGGRGFFVAYLTSDLPSSDYPSQGIINGLKSSIEVTSKLLVKNLAMSSAMAFVHEQNNDFTSAKASQKVTQRTKNLIRKIDEDIIVEELKQLKNTISTGRGEYKGFLKRWQYDENQKEEIKRVLSNIINE